MGPMWSTRASLSTPTPSTRRSPESGRRFRHGSPDDRTQGVTHRLRLSFRASPDRPGVDEIAEYYRQRRIAAAVFTIDAGITLGYVRPSTAPTAHRVWFRLRGSHCRSNT